MKQSCRPGIKRTRKVIVDSSRAVRHLGEGLGVYATPAMLNDIEALCHDLLADHLDDGEGSVGTQVELKHLAATPEGMEVEISAEIVEVDRRAVVFRVTVRDPVEQAGQCRHGRFVVQLSKVKERIAEKRERDGKV